MSLIVCSNNEEDVNLPYDRTSLDQAPYRFRNHLIDPLELPANSEVAVQSVKCNKDGLIKISPYDQFFQFFNVNVRTSTTQTNTNLTTGSPILCSPIDVTSKDGQYVNMDEFKDGMTDGMRLGFPHPDADHSDTGTHCAVSRVKTNNSNEFEGFKMTYKYFGQEGTAHTGVGNHSTDWNFLSDNLPQADGTAEPRSMEVTLSGGTKMNVKALVDSPVSAGASNKNCCWMNEYPLSHMNGVVHFNLAGLKESGSDKLNGGFALGLIRGLQSKLAQIPYQDNEANTVSANPHSFDVCVYSEQINNKGDFFLRVGHSAYSVEQGDLINESKPVGMKEVVYYDDGDGSTFAGKTEWRAGGNGLVASGTNGYNMSTNVCKWDNLKIHLHGEKIKIEIMSTVGGGGATKNTYYTICSFAQTTNDQQAKNKNIVKAMGQTCWNLYPKVIIAKKNRSVLIEQYAGMKTSFKGVAMKYGDARRDWFCRMRQEGNIRYCQDIDCREIYQFSDALPIYSQKGVTDTGADMTVTDYENIVILGDATPEYLYTQQAQLQARLGWNSRSVLDSSAGTVTKNKVVYFSDNVPDLLDYTSMFVRLDNFTQKSYNSGTGRPSKILYQVPRFDTSNREEGNALYYEPHQRTYIKLNNTAPIKLNELQLSLCDNDEKLCSEGIVGRTVICLHFQESATPMLKTRFGM